MDLKKNNNKKPILKLKVDIAINDKESTSPERKPQHQAFINDDSFIKVYNQGRQVADVACIRGGRKRQEDTFAAIGNLNQSEQFQFFYAIFDGHGGLDVSTILSNQLHVVLQNQPTFDTDIEKAIIQGFDAMNNKILQDENIKGGSTALVAINQQNMIYIINLGDSSCVLVKDDYTLTKLNSEHDLKREDEYKRIEQRATILDRKQIPCINGEIAVTRSFGDRKHREYGLISEPEISTHRISKEDRYLIMGSDGFWDVIEKQELQHYLKQLKGPSVEFLAQQLIDLALSKNTKIKKDNMTLIIIDLKQYWL